ncbi:hypothetical protein MRB53_004486 [Persea americana]|uniref:Uncharacterized protein n=1 Tax=Persea americana TaxID=3435 RepID=A0ACC2MBC3_PERAE|nr:hypothetical protein MRB53_004486 [Persea americana]
MRENSVGCEGGVGESAPGKAGSRRGRRRGGGWGRWIYDWAATMVDGYGEGSAMGASGPWEMRKRENSRRL